MSLPKPTGISRRNAVQLLLGAAVLPPVVDALTAVPTFGRAPMETQLQVPLGDALRRIDTPGLAFTQVAQITGTGHRATFYEASWEGGRTYVRDLEMLTDQGWIAVTDPDRRFEEQWVVYTGHCVEHPQASPSWVAFDSLTKVGARTVELTAAEAGVYSLTVRWVLDGDRPEVQHVLTAGRGDDFAVGYQSFDIVDADDVEEVLCGALQHARVISEDPMPRAAWELFAPMALRQQTIAGTTTTLGVHVPADVIEFTHQRHEHASRQPFGMALRNDDGGINPTVYAPFQGHLTRLEAGEAHAFAFGITAVPADLYTVYRELLRSEYGYRRYRENVYGTTLTETVHNLVDLVAAEPPGDDAEGFSPSFSGWWSRNKGFVDVEQRQKVKAATAGVLLSAHYLTSPPDDDSLYTSRARPVVEFHLSRRNVNFTHDSSATSIPAMNRLGGTPNDAVVINALDTLLRHASGGVQALGVQNALAHRVNTWRTQFAPSLAAHQLTGDESYLAEALMLAEAYVSEQIQTPYTAMASEQDFGYTYSRFWVDLVVLYEATGNQTFLDGAYREAKRFITQTMARPVPDSTTIVGDEHTILTQFDWPTSVLPAYSGEGMPIEEVPSWYVSTTGLTFEGLGTFKHGASTEPDPGGGFTQIPGWAAFLLRLAHHAGDELMADVADNLIRGRWTTYPGYYNRQFEVATMKPEFATVGPPGIPSVYFHHMPAQLGMTMDYLLAQVFVQSDGEIDFPKVYEANFAFFNFYVAGHEPGTWYGEEGVWPYFPRGLIEVDDAQIDWVTGVGNDSLYIALMNASGIARDVTVNIATPLTGLGTTAGPEVRMFHRGNTLRRVPSARGQTMVTVPAHGLVALAVRDVPIDVPWHRAFEYADRTRLGFNSRDELPGADRGLARGLLMPRPDATGYDAYVAIDLAEPATLHYSVAGGDWQDVSGKVYPHEWTIAVPDRGATFSYRITSATLDTAPVTLRLAGEVSETVTVQTQPPATAVPGASVRVAVIVMNGTTQELTGLDVILATPSGWTTTLDPPPNSLAASERVVITGTINVPAAAALAEVELGSAVSWSGGEVSDAVPLVVRDPVWVVDLVPALTTVTQPNEEFEAVATVVNSGTQPVDVDLALVSSSSAWTVAQPNVTVPVAAGARVQTTFVVTAPGGAAWESMTTLQVLRDGALLHSVPVAMRTAPDIVHTGLAWPEYRETGEWLNSGLPGWNGIRTRYSAEGVTGGSLRWVPSSIEAGMHEVAVWFPSHANSTTAASFTVRHRDGDDLHLVDQTSGGGAWVVLGIYPLEPGNEVFLSVVHPGMHRASAARFRRLEESELEPTYAIDVPPIAAPGASVTAMLTVTAGPLADFAGCVSVEVPAGWSVAPATFTVDVAAGGAGEFDFVVTAASNAPAGTIGEVIARAGGVSAQAITQVGAADPAMTGIVDTGTSGGYSEIGVWARSTLVGHDGGSTRYAQPANQGSASWTRDLIAGRYRLSVWYPPFPNNCSTATYAVAGQTHEVTQDQRVGGGDWVVLGTWDFTADGDAVVTVSGADDGDLRADAVRWEQLSPAVPGPGCED